MKTPYSGPPKLFHRFFRWYCRPDLMKYIEGDLIELYEEKLETEGAQKANWRFIIDVLLLFRPSIIRPIEGFQRLNYFGMFKNYFKISFRNILKYKVFSFINIFGLSVAMSICLLLILMMADQKSYDQFHQNKDRVYRILSFQGSDFTLPTATTPFPMAQTLKTDYPFIEQSTQLRMGVGGDIYYEGENVEARGFFAEPSFFEIFGFDLVKGDKTQALRSPNSIIISEEIAKLIFRDENPIGQTISFSDRGLFILDFDLINFDSAPVDWGTYNITGVIDGKAYKSHLKFDVLISASSLPILYEEEKISNLSANWNSASQAYTYVRLKSGQKEEELSLALADITARKYNEVPENEAISFREQKLTAITPGIFVGNPASFRLPIELHYFLIILAFVVMISACLNYTNLSIARALTRAKEIGIRKVVGANKGSLIAQFLSESILTTLFALLSALVLLVFIKAAFMDLWINRFFEMDLQENLYVYVCFCLFAIGVGIIAGLYPSFHLSRFQPIQALKSQEHNGAKKLGIRKILNSSQFVVSLFFIITSILIYRQFHHFLQFDYGFTSENIVNVELQGNDYEILKEELSRISGVQQISAAEYMPATGVANQIDVRKDPSEEEPHVFTLLKVDENFLENLEIEIVAGRNLNNDDGETGKYVMINEVGVKKLGFDRPVAAIGQQIQIGEFGNEAGMVEVVGVLKDFRFQTPIFKDEIESMMLLNEAKSFAYLNVKVETNNIAETIGEIEQIWKTLDPIHPFKYHFFDDQLASLNQMLGDLASILGFVAFLAVCIACLGLLGMATYITERRTKEVGIRKVLGADTRTIALLLSRGFLRMLLISILIAAPLSYFVNNLWLQHFPNRVEFGFGTVLLGSCILLILGLLTIGSQTIRASKGNPVDALRME